MGHSVTREAVESGFEQFVDQTIERTAAEFSVARAMRNGTRGIGGSLVDRLLKNNDTLQRRVVQPELDDYRRQTMEQFSVLMDYVESGEPFERYRDRLLATDGFASAISSRRRKDELRDLLADRQRRLGEAVAPVVETPESEFWPAVRASLDAEEAASLVEQHFAFTWPLRENRGAFELSTSFEPKDVLGGVGGLLGGGLPTVEVTYTDEAIRAMRRAEQQVIAEALREIERQFE